MRSSKILITGGTGQVGYELARSLMPLGELVAPSRNELDLTNLEELAHAVEAIRPDVIINAAAYTAVDAAETDRDAAFLVNGTAVGVLAEQAHRTGALLIHYSTDYVFDGTKPAPYLEDDRTCPINVYGRSKLAGEELLRASGARHIILRTSWVYSCRGKNFLKTMLQLRRNRQCVSVVNDQRGAPTWARNVADATAHILASTGSPEGLKSGTYHLVAGGTASWYDFAEAAFAWIAEREATSPPRLAAISSLDYPTAAARPRNSCLDGTALSDRFALVMPHWRVAMERCLEEMNV